jgi:hypothetical protein
MNLQVSEGIVCNVKLKMLVIIEQVMLSILKEKDRKAILRRL